MSLRPLHGLGVALWAAAAAWVWAHPVGFPSDDALFLTRGVERFSVLELAPHFPGYPGLIWIARACAAVTGDAAHAVHLVSALGALALPVLAFAFVRAAGAGTGAAFLSFLGVLLNPLLPALALSMLSDSLGLALLLGYLLAIERRCWRTSGLLLGLALAARPSYAVMVGAALLAVILWERRRLGVVCAGVAAVGLASLGFVLAADGTAYFSEGVRFVSGHFSIWGAPEPGAGPARWTARLAELLGGPVGLAGVGAALAWALASLEWSRFSLRSAAALLGAYTAWMFAAQNPESARHAAPVLVLALSLLALGLDRARPRAMALAAGSLVVALCAYLTLTRVTPTPSAAPLQRASAALPDSPDALLLTQRGVEVLRAAHPELRILDVYYEASADYAMRSPADRSILRISGTPLPDPWRVLETFEARFPGESALTLFTLDPPRTHRADPGAMPFPPPRLHARDRAPRRPPEAPPVAPGTRRAPHPPR